MCTGMCNVAVLVLCTVRNGPNVTVGEGFKNLYGVMCFLILLNTGSSAMTHGKHVEAQNNAHHVQPFIERDIISKRMQYLTSFLLQARHAPSDEKSADIE